MPWNIKKTNDTILASNVSGTVGNVVFQKNGRIRIKRPRLKKKTKVVL